MRASLSDDALDTCSTLRTCTYFTMLSLFVILFVFLQCSLSTRVDFELESKVPPMWTKQERVGSQSSLILTFALRQSNLKALNDLFWQVSDPNSPSYGRYWSMKQVNELVSPTKVAIQAVMDWISTFETHSVSLRTDFIIVNTTCLVAEEMLQVKYFRFTNGKIDILRAEGRYSLPRAVSSHIDFVGGVKHFPKVPLRVKPERSRGLKRNQHQNLQDRYYVGNAVGVAPNNSQAVAQFLGQYFTRLDLQEFFSLFLQSAIGNEPNIVGPNGWISGVEASLDIEYIMSTGEDIPTTFWSTGGLTNGQEPFLQWMVDVGNTPNAPILFSVSYGDDENSLSVAYTSRVNVEFQKKGLRGISILFASGDSGVGGDYGSDCTTFVPSFPASSPFVTSVGGTDLEGWFETGPEIAWSMSGGGFSNYFARPSYQSNAVTQYLQTAKSTLPPQSFWNFTGRAYPDISSLATNFIVVENLIPTPGVDGTSCAAPTASGIIGLLNDLRLQNNLPQLGFLNPLLYSLGRTNPQVFTDITIGGNWACASQGFSCTTGWDPVTGFGSLNYAALAKVINKVPGLQDFKKH